jgi:hypothetical protein
MQPGDYLLCYLTGISRWIGLLEVGSTPFKDCSPIWADEDFPCRMRVSILIALTPETAVPVLGLQDRLSIFRDLKSPRAWTGHFRGSPMKWKAPDAEIVIEALQEAQRNPTERPVNPARLARRPRALKARVGSVTVPERDESSEDTTLTTREPTLLVNSRRSISNTMRMSFSRGMC